MAGGHWWRGVGDSGSPAADENRRPARRNRRRPGLVGLEGPGRLVQGAPTGSGVSSNRGSDSRISSSRRAPNRFRQATPPRGHQPWAPACDAAPRRGGLERKGPTFARWQSSELRLGRREGRREIGSDCQDCPEQGRRAPHARHDWHNLEHVVGRERNDRHAEPGLRHPGKPAILESQGDCPHAHDRPRPVHRRLVRARAGRTDARTKGGGVVSSGSGVRMELEDSAMAGGGLVDRVCYGHHLLLRARCGTGMGLDHARIGLRGRCSG